MKNRLLSFGILWVVLSCLSAKNIYAADLATLLGPKNLQYACVPPFISQAAKPNIHFVLDNTGSMEWHPYVMYDNSYYPTTLPSGDASGYWGYFKENMYYKYNVTNNNYWEENTSCTNTDKIGTTNSTTGVCISGKLLNYATSNKYDIMRKILTGGRVWTNSSGVVQDSTVLEHEMGSGTRNLNEPTTNCDYEPGTGTMKISSPNPSSSTTNIHTSSTNISKTIAVAKVGTTKVTFTRNLSDWDSWTGITAGSLIVTAGNNFNAANRGTWTVESITARVITVVMASNVAIVAQAGVKSVTIKSTTLSGPICKVLVNTTNKAMTVTADNKFTRNDGGSFVTDGWVAGMNFDSFGFADSNNMNGNNPPFTVSAVNDSEITISSTGLTVNATPRSASLLQNLTAYVRVKSSTPADFTGIIQTLYIGPGNADNKADIEMSFFDSTTGVDYTASTVPSGATTTVKNQAQANYLNAVNLCNAGGSTNTGPAMIEAEKFFRQEAVASSTKKPSSGTKLIDKKNGASDPYYNPPATGTPSNTNSIAASCRKSFVILISDGEWNSGADPVGPAYNMHRRDEITPSTTPKTYYDIRPDAAEAPMSGVQSVTTYTVYAFGSTSFGRNALITTAIFGGFDDIDNNKLPYPFNVYPLARPYTDKYKDLSIVSPTNASNSVTFPPTDSNCPANDVYCGSATVAGTSTLFVGDDLPTFPLDQCKPGATKTDVTTVSPRWDSHCAEWDKSQTGLPYNYFEATDGAVLAQAMTNAVNDILARTSSSTAASILGNNDNAGASLVQALFYPEKQFDGTLKASWIGEVQAFWYYLDPRLQNVTIREDSDEDLALQLNEDKVAELKFDGTYTKVNLYADANGDGSVDNYTVPPTNPDSTIDVEAVNNIWRAGKTLWSRTASNRTIYTNDPTVSTVAGSRIDFNVSSATPPVPTVAAGYFDVSTASGAVPTVADVINYTRGTDISPSTYSVRQRTIQLESTQNTWKLGDVINSTPKMASEVRLNSYNLIAPSGYSDSSYDKYIKSKDYSYRGTAYVGANDGMLHAFKTGSNFAGTTSGVVANIKNADGSSATELGKETWAFIPKNALPYLQYMMLPGYQHIYSVDGSPLLVDASINPTTTKDSSGNPLTCTDSTYHLCGLTTTVDKSTGQLLYTGAGTSWRTVLLSSMGLGGASRYSTATCTNCVKSPLASLGLSSYFALDVTNPISEAETDYPKLLWEFSDPRLGFTTVTPAVVRIKDTNDTAGFPRNGRWVAILASGPTGPITAAGQSFDGKSDMPLTIFVVDLKTGALLRTFNNLPSTDAINSAHSSVHTQVTDMPSNAFAGSLSGSSIDLDKYNSTLDERASNSTNPKVAYSDDAVYIGYARGNAATPTAWDKGGVLRMLTYNNYSPANWKVSRVIDGIGPVTSSVNKLQDKYNHQLWLYFGSGRYFIKGDDPDNVQSLFGVKDTCYNNSDTFTANCTDSLTVTATATASVGAIVTGVSDQTTLGTVDTTDSNYKGWKIDLGIKAGTNFTKRVISNPVASTSGVVTFTTFTPSQDVCTYGGTTSVWALKYNTGGVGSTNLKGQILIQLSTGAFEQIDVSKAFTQSGNRETPQYQGVPPKSEPAITTNANHTPSKRILHIQER